MISKKSMFNQKHEFAFYRENLSLIMSQAHNHELIITDEHLYHRMVHVLRLTPTATCIFFDREIHVYCTIIEFSGKKNIKGIAQSRQLNKIITPHIRFLLPLLKRDDLDSTLYALAEIGINSIELVTTEKTRQDGGQREF